MRFSISAVAVAATFAFVNAQDLSGIPTCALTCFAAAVPPSGCSLTDTKCQCTTGKDKIQSSIETCAPQRCSVEDAAKIAPAVQAICERAGISVSVPTTLPSGFATASGSRNGTSGITGSQTQTGSGTPQQTGNAAGINGVSVGIMAAGMAAVFGL